MISEKKLLPIFFREKKILPGNSWGKKYPSLKKDISRGLLSCKKKNITLLNVEGKNYISRDLGKKILTQTNQPYPPVQSGLPRLALRYLQASLIIPVKIELE